MKTPYDAVVLVSFGGPEHPDDVIPFLENVLRGKNVPRARMLQVAEHYDELGGVSPINSQNRALLAALIHELNTQGRQLPVYWGNRNWHPLLPDTVRQMADDGVQHALAFVTSAYNSFSGCRQYLGDIVKAREEVGAAAPRIDKLRAFHNHPGFIEPMVERVTTALHELPPGRRERAVVLFTAHSIPIQMAETCDYVDQLQETSRLIAEAVGSESWRLVYQSRSGPPSQPWLEPDVCDVLGELAGEKSREDVVIVPVGFISDHVEVVYDLDIEARAVCEQGGLNMVRAGTVGTHPRFVRMIRELIDERFSENPVRAALGNLGPPPDICPPDCCRYEPVRPTRTGRPD
jgi:ferrochelatase